MSEIRDPIYGFITPSETEFKIIDTSLFQRLRKIKQLAMAYLVYPGANHTRFDHSLGVYHIASLMAEKLFAKEDEEKKRIVRFSALLHDIGHGPFSHVSEYILNKYSPEMDKTEKEKIHEKITRKLIEHNKELGIFLSNIEKEKIIGLLSGEKVELTLMREIISGPLDADKMDYLLRDGYFCGVKYGTFDLERMLNTITFHESRSDKNKFIAINYDGINSLEQFVLAKYYMITQVYRHKVRKVTDAMIIRGLELGIEKDNINFLNKLYRYEDTEDYVKNYLNYWDDKVINELICLNKPSLAKEIFERLNNRKLFKIIFSQKLNDIEITDEKFRDIITDITSKENDNLRKTIEKEIASIMGNVKEDNIIVNSFRIKNVKEMARNSEDKIQIIDNDGKPKSFEDESTVFRSINESMTDTYFEVYAPLEDSAVKDKIKKINELKTGILNILKEMKR